MSTKTMRLPPRRLSMPSTPGGPIPTNKRKEREDGFDGPKPSSTPVTTTTKLLKPDKPRTRLEPPSRVRGLEPPSRVRGLESPEPPSDVKGLEPAFSNQLLAGYLAQEYLTSGTLFGQPWDPSRAEGPASYSSLPMPGSERRKGKAIEKREGEVVPNGRAEQTQSEKYARYMEVASLLKKDGAQLPGIVNPTQLARFLQMI